MSGKVEVCDAIGPESANFGRGAIESDTPKVG